jgi:hypothetical protein
MNSVSPVSTACGVVEPFARSYTRIETLSGVWPGVSRNWSRTLPSDTLVPSRIGSNGNSASARAPTWIAAPVRSRSSRCPATKSAWKWVRKT